MREGYDVALICLNGHVINSSAFNFPEGSTKHCGQCGEPGINACPQCSGQIRGMYWGGILGSSYDRPSFCTSCGTPYPWTTRHMKAAQDLAATLGELSESQQQSLRADLESVVKDVPETPAAAGRLKKLIATLGRGAGSALRDIIVDMASETAKRVLLG